MGPAGAKFSEWILDGTLGKGAGAFAPLTRVRTKPDPSSCHSKSANMPSTSSVRENPPVVCCTDTDTYMPKAVTM
jgi:hypothetical protein